MASAYDNVPYKFFRTTDGGADLGESHRGLPRRLHARARGLAGHRRGLHRHRRTARGCCRRPMPTPRRPLARRRRATSGASATSTPPTEPGGSERAAGRLHRSATCRHMACAGAGVEGRGGRDAGRGRFHPCDHDAVQRGAAEAPRSDAARPGLAGRPLRALREILPALGGGADRGRLHLDHLFRRRHAAAAARPDRGLPAGSFPSCPISPGRSAPPSGRARWRRRWWRGGRAAPPGS